MTTVAALYVEPDGVYAGLPEVITREDAKSLGLKRFFVGKPCKQGHLAERSVSSYGCMECARLRALAWKDANPEKRREIERATRKKNAVKIAAQKKAWKANNRDKHNQAGWRHRIRRFIPLEEYQKMLEAQAGRCAICGTDKGYSRGGDGRRMAIDHCHATGEVRGLLCGNCNRMLGIAGDDPAVLRKAAEYIEKTK